MGGRFEADHFDANDLRRFVDQDSGAGSGVEASYRECAGSGSIGAVVTQFVTQAPRRGHPKEGAKERKVRGDNSPDLPTLRQMPTEPALGAVIDLARVLLGQPWTPPGDGSVNELGERA